MIWAGDGVIEWVEDQGADFFHEEQRGQEEEGRRWDLRGTNI
jgi:hypothetical protein